MKVHFSVRKKEPFRKRHLIAIFPRNRTKDLKLTRERIELGKLGEELAYKKIKKLGYRKIIRNFRCPLGEVDIIAKDGDTLVFLEIKTRKKGSLAYAKEAVDERKKRQLSKVALSYLKSNDLDNVKARFDVVAICLEGDEPEIELIKNAFNLTYG
jgi:putative endonuclease